MERLTKIIEQAPSELSKEKLYERVKRERQRVSEALADWRAKHQAKLAKAKAKADKAAAAKAKKAAAKKAKSNPTKGKAKVRGK